jgi:glycosyltransferase involved in cell wall biosynthesis
VTGFVVSPGDVDGLADRLLVLADDLAAARSMGLAGRRRYLERYTWERVAEKIVGAIQPASQVRRAAVGRGEITDRP